MTRDLEELSDWLLERGVTDVAMEATGVYWKPVWHVLEDSFELVLANAAHIRNVPGRKSDVNDATWIADLLAHGLIQPSFVPPAGTQELRTLTRTRKQLSREVAQHTQRIQKVLEDANIKLSSVASEVLGASGRAILRALIAGQTDPEKLTDLAEGRLKASRSAIVESLRGRVLPHHRTLLRVHLGLVEALEKEIAGLEQEVRIALRSQPGKVERLCTMPGLGPTSAQTLVAEIGMDMSRFPTPGHLISWAGLCPAMNESAGKKKSTRLRPGNPWLKTMLVQAAWAATRKKDGYLRAQFVRIRARRGPKKAVIAVASSMLKAAYFILRDDVDYKDLGSGYFDVVDKARLKSRLVKKLEGLGYKVDLSAEADAN
jgi:transposase